MARRLAFCACMMSLFVIITAATESFAIDDSTIKATEQIKKNPAAMEILKKIEMSKKILAEMQQTKKIQEQKSLILQEAKKTTQAKLSSDLERMNKDYQPYTPKNAFERFVADKPAQIQSIYWAMFNYQQDKVKSAQDARSKVLSSGGTSEQAWKAYQTESAIKRIKMIELTKDYNVKYAGASAATQLSFDKNGKLPRSD